MISDNENVQTLMGLGLTGAQARIYLALLGVGTASIREISEASAVARPDTYRAVTELERLGIVEKILTTSSKYKPLQLSEALSILMGRREKESIDLQKKSARLLEAYKKIRDDKKSPAEDSQFVLIPEGGALSSRIERMIETSQKSICIMIPQKILLQRLIPSFNTLEKAMEKNTAVKIITEKPTNSAISKEILKLQKSAPFEIRYLTIPPSVYFEIFDGKEILLTTTVKADYGDSPAVWSNNSSLVELAQNYFDAAWFATIEPPNQAFKRDRKQFDYLFTNMFTGFSYNKMIFEDGKPADFVILEVNDTFTQITGQGKEAIGQRLTELFPDMKKDSAGIIEIYGKVCTTGQSAKFEYYSKQNGKWYSILAYSPEKGYFATILEDITERKKAEETLRESETRYRSLFENLLSGFVYGKMVFDEEGKPTDYVYLQVNDAFTKLTGLKKESVVGKKITEAIPETEKLNPEIFEIFGRVALTGKEERFEIFFKPLNRWFSIGVYSPGKGYFVAVFENITERKKAEQAMLQSEEKFRMLFESSLDAIFVANTETGIIVDCNSAASELVGRKKSELIGQKQRILHPQKGHANGLTESFKRHLKENSDTIETQVVTKTGEIKDVAIKANFVEIGGKKMLQGTFRDITELKRKESQLTAERDKLNFVTESADASLLMIGRDYKVLWHNKVLREKYGDLHSKTCYLMIQNRSTPCPECSVRRIFEKNELSNTREFCFKDKEGKTQYVEITCTPVKDKNGAIIGVLELGMPITKRKQAEEALKTNEERLNLAQKVAHIGSWEWDIKSETPIWSEELCRILDVNPQQASKALQKRVHPDDIKAFNNTPKCLKTKGDRAFVDYRIILDDGSIRFLHSEQMVTEVDEAGKPRRIVGVEQDITERRKTEAAL